MRLVLAVAAGVLALLCFGGVGIAFALYDDATKIERTAPDAVVDNYLRAALVQRDEERARLYTCAAPELAPIAALVEEFVRREKRFTVTVSVGWGTLTQSPVGENVDIATDLTITGSSNGQPRSRRNETWRFRVVDEDGWRVCAASKVS